jgi:hypothetical protein
LRRAVLQKKSVAKVAGLSYFHTQLHHMVPGQSGLPQGASGAKQEKTLTTNKNNIGGTR